MEHRTKTAMHALRQLLLVAALAAAVWCYTYDEGNSDLLNAFNAFLGDIVADGEYYEIYEAYYGTWTEDEPFSPYDCTLSRHHWPREDAIADEGAFQDILSNRAIHVTGTNLGAPGAFMQYDNGTYYGFEVELIERFAVAVSRKYGVGSISVDVSIYDDGVTDSLGTFSTDATEHFLIGALTNTVARRAVINFACGSLNTGPIMMIGSTVHGDLDTATWSTFNSSAYTFCVEEGTVFDDYRETYCPATVRVSCSATAGHMCIEDMLQGGLCDLLPTDLPTAQYLFTHEQEKMAGVTLGPMVVTGETLAVVVSKDAPFYYYGNELLVQTWNEAYRLFDWASAQASTMANTTTAPPPELNIDTSYVMERNDVRYPTGVLRTVLDLTLLTIGYIPWPGFHDVADNGTHTGFEVLMAENFISYILDQYGVSLVPVWVDMSAKSIREVVQALQDGDVTLVLGGVLSRSDRTSSGTFGGIYYTTEMTVLANTAVGVGAVTDIAALNVPTTTACKYSINRCADLTDSHLSAATVVQMDTMDECLDAVASGAADVFLCTRVMFENARDADPTLAATTAVWDGTVTRGEFMAPVFRNDALSEKEEEPTAIKLYARWRLTILQLAIVLAGAAVFMGAWGGCTVASGFFLHDQVITRAAVRTAKPQD
ncbi:extracellular solute-binding protein, family 3 [Carpediemonas membranifera]|uniref:Extracellular solute-binding protein, family 3 n=1 Tax=Carpediemonas membranifera TaxID=201153 RepID=A0A8J6E272_9EUKA|nr:extracellular solute-binding protein, family 3 [Carpediemonas membranifera]|eukprot:KAG9394328.1 extracellular solute-binding protein, family 3 [Carpediemonas membranifera]